MAHRGRTDLHRGCHDWGPKDGCLSNGSPGFTIILSWQHHIPELLRLYPQEPNTGHSSSGSGVWKVGSQGYKKGEKASQQDSQNKHTACYYSQFTGQRQYPEGLSWLEAI